MKEDLKAECRMHGKKRVGEALMPLRPPSLACGRTPTRRGRRISIISIEKIDIGLDGSVLRWKNGLDILTS